MVRCCMLKELNIACTFAYVPLPIIKINAFCVKITWHVRCTFFSAWCEVHLQARWCRPKWLGLSKCKFFHNLILSKLNTACSLFNLIHKFNKSTWKYLKQLKQRWQPSCWRNLTCTILVNKSQSKPKCSKTSQELWMLSPSLFIQGSQCKC